MQKTEVGEAFFMDRGAVSLKDLSGVAPNFFLPSAGLARFEEYRFSDSVSYKVSFSPRMPLTLDLLIPDIPFSYRGIKE